MPARWASRALSKRGPATRNGADSDVEFGILQGVLTLRYVICDVFTEQPLEGNPLCVFTDARALNPEKMQALARELNLSETTFVLPAEQGGHARVRIFTPERELPFAGHPTLGTAFVLGGPMEIPELRLELNVGIVPVRLEREGARVSFGWMTQPAPKPIAGPDQRAVLEALGLRSEPVIWQAYENGPRHLCLGVADAATVRELRPDFSALARACEYGVGVFHHEGSVCKARYFVPALGVNEDPATGSFAGPLAFQLVRDGRLPAGETLRIEQGAEVKRPSTLFARVSFAGNGSAEPAPRVEVGGSARVVARGQFVI
jgi:trans-2,3-dihydro-3-hydroxyanthranilate isomerase